MATAVVDGRRVIVSVGDTTVRLWDLAAGGLVGEPLTGHLGRLIGVATIVLDGRPHAVTIGMYTTARLWDLTAGRQVGPCLSRYPATDVSAIPLMKRATAAFSGTSLHQVFAVATAQTGDGGVAVVCGEDGAQVWDLATGEAKAEPLTRGMAMVVATADIDGRTVAVTAGGPDPVRLWDLDTGEQVGELPGEIVTEGPVTALAAEEVDGRTVIMTAGVRLSGASSIEMWDPVTCLPIGEPMEHRESHMLLGSVTIATLDGRPCVVAGGAIPPGHGVLATWVLTIREQLGETQVFPSGVSAVTRYPEGSEGSLAVAFGIDVVVLTGSSEALP